MITIDKAKKIGLNACIDKLGREFVEKYQESSSSAFGDRGDYLYCFLGVNNQPETRNGEGLLLTSDSQFPYVARCKVDYEDGRVSFLECVIPTL